MSTLGAWKGALHGCVVLPIRRLGRMIGCIMDCCVHIAIGDRLCAPMGDGAIGDRLCAPMGDGAIGDRLCAPMADGRWPMYVVSVTEMRACIRSAVAYCDTFRLSTFWLSTHVRSRQKHYVGVIRTR
jgi:hypothetical protein